MTMANNEMVSIGKENAITLANSEWWKELTAREVVEFQLSTKELCLPFGEFHRLIEEALGRPVFTHEFASIEHLHSELRGEKPPPSFEEILSIIPAEKRILIITENVV